MEILGVGAAEVVVVALLMLIVAGPKRSAEWARQIGIYVGKMREMWNRMMADLRSEMGDDADELLKTAQEFQRTAADFRQQTSVRNVAGKAISLAEKSAAKSPNQAQKPSSNGNSDSERYSAWTQTPSEESSDSDASS